MHKSAHCRLPSLPRSPQVVLRLHIHPQLWRRAQGSRQSDGHGGGDSGLAVEYARERHARNAQMGRCRGHGQVSKILAKNLTGMGWIVHTLAPVIGRQTVIAALVIVLIVDEDRILNFKLERQTPVPADTDRPVILEFPGQPMQFPSWSI